MHNLWQRVCNEITSRSFMEVLDAYWSEDKFAEVHEKLRWWKWYQTDRCTFSKYQLLESNQLSFALYHS